MIPRSVPTSCTTENNPNCLGATWTMSLARDCVLREGRPCVLEEPAQTQRQNLFCQAPNESNKEKSLQSHNAKSKQRGTLRPLAGHTSQANTNSGYCIRPTVVCNIAALSFFPPILSFPVKINRKKRGHKSSGNNGRSSWRSNWLNR